MSLLRTLSSRLTSLSPSAWRASPSLGRLGGARCLSSALQYGNADIDSSKLQITKNPSPGEHPPHDTLVFGHTFTDHMLQVDWKQNEGWTNPEIIPFGDMPMHPASTSLHYGIQCFEGMKAYVDQKDQVRLFRPMKNMVRFNHSCERLMLPTFNGEELLECIKELVRTDRGWIPKEHGYSLYIRPTAISTEPFLGVQPVSMARVFVILSPVGPYYKSGFAPVKLYADPKNVRAWPGGVGNVKCGGNYAMSLQAQVEGKKLGYAQVMWLFGDDHEVTEVGTMNQFFFWVRPDGKKELITAPLDGTILPGVTRDSILKLAREWGEFEVTERKYTLKEVIHAVEEGRMLEAFGSGTAAIVSPVNGFHFQGAEYDIPLDKNDPSAQAGPLTHRFVDTLMAIQYGDVEHPWSVVI